MALLKLFLVAGLLAVSLPVAVAAESAAEVSVREGAGEAQLKAAFIYHFTQLVSWPTNAFSSADAPIVVAVIGADSIARQLEEMVVGRRVQGRPILVRQGRRLDSQMACQVLYAGSNEALHAALADLGEQPVLTVGEGRAFIEAGGMIGLVRENDNLRFVVNRRRARAVGLRLSSKLLHLATIVTDEPTGEDR